LLSRVPVQDPIPVARRGNLLPAYCLLFLFAGLALFFRLGELPFTGADEPRYARIAEEMYRTGDWVTPRLQGDSWLEKPPLYYWLTIPLYALFGASETTARMAPALCALASLAAVCWAGTRLWSPLAGWLAGMITASSIGFCVFGRGASIDMPFTACFTGSFALLAVAACAARPARGLRPAAYALLGAAALGKGPLAFALAAGILFVFWVVDERGGSLRRLRALSGLALAAAVAAPWYWMATLRHGFSFIAVFFINHNLARYVSEIHHHAAPVYYYIPVVPGLLFPWSAWLLVLLARAPACLKGWRGWDAGRLFAACWAVFPLLFFSLSGSKLPGYALVSLPPISLLMAAGLADFMEGAGKPPGRAGAWLHFVLSCGAAAALPLVARGAYRESAAELWGPALALLPPAAAAGWLWLRGRWRGALLATAAQGLVLVLALAQFSFPLLARQHSTREIAQAALAARREAEPIALYRFFHHTFHYYTGYRVAANLQDTAALARFARENPSFLVVTEVGYLAEIRGIQELSASELGAQGKLRLLRLARR